MVALPAEPPIITRLLVLALAGVFILGFLIGQERLILLGAKENTLILAGGEYYRLVSVMFVHANPIHLLMNAYALWVIGEDVERFYGHLRFALIFFLGGLTASVASLAMNPHPAVGASGGVFAVFAAEMVLLYRNRALFGASARQRLQSLVFLLLINAGIGFVGQSFIDNWAHMGGFVGGAVLSWALAPRYHAELLADGSGRLVEDDAGGRPVLVTVAWLLVLAGLVTWLTLAAGS
jgi:rhomboid protease GluP